MSGRTTILLHITTEGAWRRALEEGYYTPPNYLAEGFIHLSTVDQVIAVANRFYHGLSQPILLAVDPNRIQAELRYETSDERIWYPHLYGPLNLKAVIAVLPFPCDSTGTYFLPGFLAEYPHQ